MAGNVKSAQAITAVFTTSSPTTGAATNADSLPTGAIYINGTVNAAAVTITNIDAGRYKAAVTLPALSAGDVVDLSISATVGAVAGKGVVWSAVGITKRVSELVDAVAPDNTSIATILTRTDVATSTRNATTPPTVAAIRSEMDSNSTKLDVAVSTRLASSGYTVPPTVVQTRQEMDSNSTKLANLDAAVSSRLAATSYTAPSTPPTAAAISDAVWDELAADHISLTTMGGKLNTAGSAADPLLNPVPGSYPSGTAGYALGRLVGSSVTITAPVISSGNVQIIRGDSYYSADARALVWSITGLPTINLSGAVTTFKAKKTVNVLTKTNSTTPGVTASYNAGVLTLTVELSAEDTDPLVFGPYTFDIQTEFSNPLHVETWVSGTMTVAADVR
jgi:hypothetical protein